MFDKKMAITVCVTTLGVAMSATGAYAAQKGTVTANSLNIRSGLSTSCSVVTKAKKGTTLEVLESNKGWYKVMLPNGIKGWVSSTYISSNLTSNVQTSSSTAPKKGLVNTSFLNIRSGPGVNNGVTGKIFKGTSIAIIETKNGWHRIKTSNGIIGWVNGSYIASSEGAVKNPVTTQEKLNKVIGIAKAQLGKPYIWGAEGPNSFDCSGLTHYVYKNAAKITLPRTSSAQSKAGTSVSLYNIKPGDLVFFDSTKDGKINHVGIYIGNNEYIHSPRSGDVVKISKTTESYFKKNLVKIKRFL